MRFVLVVHVRISKPFSHWKHHFDHHRAARQAGGIEDVFCYPVIGEQAVIYGVRTSHPRAVHDMVYDEQVRPLIEESGFVIGSEVIHVCEDVG